MICSVLEVVVLALCLELGFGLMRKEILEPEFTEEMVRRDVILVVTFGEKVRILEDELMGFAKSGNFF